MSIDREFYVGPVARCRFTPVTKNEPTGARKCRMHGDQDEARYCGECGAKTVVVVRNESRAPMDPIDDDDFGLMEFSGENWPKDEHVYLVNLTPDMPQRRFNIDNEEHFESLADDTRARDLAYLEKEHAADIAKLRKLYGADNVTLAWGVFRWCQ